MEYWRYSEFCIFLGEKDYLCGTCGKAFSDKKLLRIHLQTHNDVKPYSCSTCNKRFSYPSSLSSHKKVHYKEKIKTNEEKTPEISTID